MSMAITCGSDRPDWKRNSTALSVRSGVAALGHDDREELLDFVAVEGAVEDYDWQAVIQLTLPRMVLISPLWAT